MNSNTNNAAKTMTAVTPHGTFGRTTDAGYAFVVVRESPRARGVAELAKAGRKVSGVYARWTRDRGFVTTWHKTESAARAEAARPYPYDDAATCLGVYPVTR